MEIVLVIEMNMASGLTCPMENWSNEESSCMLLAIAMASCGKILCWTKGRLVWMMKHRSALRIA